MSGVNKLFGKKPTYDELLDLVSVLLEKVEVLTAEVKDLRSELAVYKNPKNSGNSSVPPSQDQNRPRMNQSLREKSGRKSGGQPGHKGHTLSMVGVPDQVVSHYPDTCTHCGKHISEIVPVFCEKRQIVEIPPVKPIYIQHEIFSRTCSCGKVSCGTFPQELVAPVQYGESIQSLVAYLSVRHYVPYKRITEIMEHMYNVPLSEGTIANILQKKANDLYPAYMQIKSNIERAKATGGDETGIIVNGKLHWIWTWQDLLNTFLIVSDNRGSAAVKEFFPDGLPNSILISDAWAAQLSTPAKGHQLCLAHMLRELNYFIELFPLNHWLENIKSLFLQAIRLKKEMTEKDYHKSNGRDKILKSFKRLLSQPPPKESKIFSFYRRVLKWKESIFPFLFNPDVPPDNNASERSIRNVKVKQKVSGQFKTFDGAQSFAIIRSVIDTLIKQNLDILGSLTNIPNLVPE